MITDRKQLRQLASAATQGPRQWQRVEGDGKVTEHTLTGTGRVLCRYWRDDQDPDAEFLAAVTPALVVAMVDKSLADDEQLFRQIADIERLREALVPFARMAEKVNPEAHDDQQVIGSEGTAFFVRDLRQARKVIGGKR